MGQSKSAAKRERRDQAKKAKAERIRLARRRKRLRWVAGVAIAAVVVGLASWGIAAFSRAQQIEGVVDFGRQDRDHTEGPVTYEQSPPVGGDHSATPLTCGVYSEPVPNENAVHSLEHGAVWITYRPDLDAEDVVALRDYVISQDDSQRSYLILSPYDDLPASVVVTSWRRQLQLDHVDDPRLAEFASRFVGSSRAPEPGAPCRGVGVPEL